MSLRFGGGIRGWFRPRLAARPNEAARGDGDRVMLLVTNVVRPRRMCDRRSQARIVREQRAQLDGLRQRLRGWADDRKLTGIEFLPSGHRLALRVRCSEDVMATLQDFPDLVVVRDRMSIGVV